MIGLNLQRWNSIWKGVTKMFKKRTPSANLSRQKECEEKLRTLAFDPIEKVYEETGAQPEGLSSVVALERLDENGPNQITSGKHETKFGRLIKAFINPFNIVLFLVALVTFFTDIVSGDTNHATVIIILVLITISSLISFFQDESSNEAAANLSKMISNRVDVIRDSQVKEIDITEVVKGDVVKLSAGDIIPGDIRFLTAKDAFISQAALTGESNPVEKFVAPPKETDIALTDIQDLGFMGSNMMSGSATGVVLSTGNDTYFGSMAKSLSGERSKNSFEKGVESVSRLLITCMVIMVPLIFVINGLTKGDWSESLVFAVTMAVGLTPEMLPVIMTSTLAKGAVAMSKHETIVKNLSSIQTFGEMDILCTDKTGTLTEDKIILEKYMDVDGNENDSRVLKHAYLNSYFQTGLRNLIDVAILNRGNLDQIQYLQTDYRLIDEIPFDFSRRRMSVVVDDEDNKRQLITKGAVDEIMQSCKYIMDNGEAVLLTPELYDKAYKVYQKNNDEGLRIIAVAERNNVEGIENFSVADEKDMVLLGFIGFLDPPKESAKQAIAALKNNGVRTVVLTGDSEGVAIKVCEKVNVATKVHYTGLEVEKMTDEELLEAVKVCDLFSKLSPTQKQRVVSSFQHNGHTVGYMGDGINDAPSLRQADVGISVDSAVDIAKESADIILLKKDLMVLDEGVIEGRKTFTNIIKYIKMAVSGNFGNMISVTIASIFLPFLPQMPVQILTQNLLCDFSQLGIPYDNVDPEYIKKPRRWDAKGIQRFMLWMGPLSSLFDILCWVVMIVVFGTKTSAGAPLFQAGWFIFGTMSQILIVQMIRTAKIPFKDSMPSKGLIFSTLIVSVVAFVISFSPTISSWLEMSVLPVAYIPWLILLLVAYAAAVQIFKKFYIRRFKEWL